MQMGMAVIIEDYIHRHITRTVLLLASAFACWGGMALTILCVLKVALIRGGQ
jgi:succinate dehydrogenase hydrophobic anchor subunit